MTEGSARPVAQVGSDPQLVAFGDDVRRQALMPGWDFQSVQSNEPVPVELAYRWSWADVLRPMTVKAYDVVDPVKASYKTVPRSSYEDLESFRKTWFQAEVGLFEFEFV